MVFTLCGRFLQIFCIFSILSAINAGCSCVVKLRILSEKVDEAINKLDDVKLDLKTLNENFIRMESQTNRIVPATRQCIERSFCRTPGIAANVQPEGATDPLTLLCDADRWIVVMQRFSGAVKFNMKDWSAYKKGIGFVDADQEFFIGLQALHDLTNGGDYELRVELENFENERRTAHYSAFKVGDERSDFKLESLGEYTGDAGDSFKCHEGQRFSTLDRDHDARPLGSCAEEFNSAGWFKNCMNANLFGDYLNGKNSYPQQGMYWGAFGGTDYSLKRVTMLIRSKC